MSIYGMSNTTNSAPEPDPCLVSLRTADGAAVSSERAWRKARACAHGCGRYCKKDEMFLRFQCDTCESWFPGGRNDCPYCGEPIAENVTAQGTAVDELWRRYAHPAGNGLQVMSAAEASTDERR